MPAFSSIALGIAGLGSLAGGIIGHLSQMSAQDRAKLLQDQGVQEWLKANIPDPEKQKLALDRFVSSGQLTPELETAVKTADTQLKNVQVDPRLKEARLRALNSLEQQGYGGQQVQDEAALQQDMIESGAAARGRNLALEGAMERRGQLGSGLELQAGLSNAQADQDRAASNALSIEGQRRQRALQSIMGAGDLAGNIQQQDYDMKSNAAKAQDAINQFNSQMLANTNMRNVDRSNNAQQYNLQNAQNISNQNVGLSNFQQQYNKELLDKQFNQQAQKAAGLSGQYNQQANQAIQNGQSAANMWGKVASGIGSAATAAIPMTGAAASLGGATVNPQVPNYNFNDPDWWKNRDA